MIELLNELRLTLPGVQVLFAFLLILPFQQRFNILADAERVIYVLALVPGRPQTICLIAPASYHRLGFRARDKQQILFFSNRLAIVGIFFLALAMVAGLFLITKVVVGAGVGSPSPRRRRSLSASCGTASALQQAPRRRLNLQTRGCRLTIVS